MRASTACTRGMPVIIVGLILSVLGDGNDGKRAKRHVAAAINQRGPAEKR
jgi:hypothetical protein